MFKYTKIPTIFRRDTTGSKKLIEGDYIDDTLEFISGLDWEWTEKVDGTNISIEWNGTRITFHGRTENAQLPANLVNYLTETFGGPINEELFEQTFGEQQVILFGEGYGGNIQKVGKLYNDNVGFILFDIYLPEQNLWLARFAVESIAQIFNIKVVPIVGIGSLDKAVEYVKTKPRSVVAEHDAPMEGVVCRPRIDLLDRRGRRMIVKVKVKDFE